MAAIIGAVLAGDRHIRVPRIFRDRKTLMGMRDFEVLGNYRLTREGIDTLVQLLEPNLTRETNRSCPISVLTQILIGLRYVAKGDMLSEVAEIHDISRSSACNIIDNFVKAVNDKLDNIRFPEGRELEDVTLAFYNRCGIPNTIGAVDGSLIPIIAPHINEEIYVCRKNFHAINIQACVDHRGRFTDIVARWPGSTHDASIFDNCALKRHTEDANIGHLLGDGGYPLRKFLLTPVLRPSTEAEQRYNHAHSVGRMVVERSFGMMKSRFRCLHKTGGCLYRTPERCCRVITACARLHNFCVSLNIPMPEIPDLRNDNANNLEIVDAGGAAAYRQQIVDLFV